MLDRFLSTLSMVCRIPVRVKFTFDPSRMDFYLPLTGICAALPGLLIAAVYSLCVGYITGNFQPSQAEIPVLIVIFMLLVQYLGFNLFHLDGLMDTADAFLGSADREKRLIILKDSRIGVYGFFAGFAALSLKAALLCALLPAARAFPALVFAWPLWGRFSAALVPCITPPLKPGGLGALAKDSRLSRCFGGVILALFLWTLLVYGLFKLISLAAPSSCTLPCTGNAAITAMIIAALCLFVLCPLTALFYARMYRKALGGYSGDALGAAIETAELLCLLAALPVRFMVL